MSYPEVNSIRLTACLDRLRSNDSGGGKPMADDDNTKQMSGEKRRSRFATEFWMIVLSLVILMFTAIIFWSYMYKE